MFAPWLSNNKIIINTSALKLRLLNLVNLVQLLRRCCKNKSWVLNLGDVQVLFLNTNIIRPQQHVVRGGGAGAALALGGDGGAPGRRHRSTGRKTHFGNFCRLQRNRQPSLPPKTESLISQKRVRIGASLPIQPPLSLLRPPRTRLLVARTRQTRARSANSET